MLLRIFRQKNIVLSVLFLLIFGRLIFRFDQTFLEHFVTIFGTTLIFQGILASFWKGVRWNHKNSFIIASILVLILLPVPFGFGTIFLIGCTLITLLLRACIRTEGAPVVNPVVFGLLILTGVSLLTTIPVYIAWSGMNYTVNLFGMKGIPYATIISIVGCLALIVASKKYWYAFGFFVSFAFGVLVLFGGEFLIYLFRDGTIYFFFGVMALEPKTGVRGLYQGYFGLLLGILLVLFLKFYIPGDYVLALALVGGVYFFLFRRNNALLLVGKTYPKGQKWLCVPCGYIYDPLLGDSDSGIAPGTEFSDIPDDWSCPVCGVMKSDFVPYSEEEMSVLAEIVSYALLNPTTLRLVLRIPSFGSYQAGQYMMCLFEDENGLFQRSYSIASVRGDEVTFFVKIVPDGRGGKKLKQLGLHDTIRVSGPYGSFLLRDTDKPKIFIATGTGLAPIYAMLRMLPRSVEKTLYFSVSYEEELFYLKELKKIAGLKTEVHVTREKVEGFHLSRIDIGTIDAPLDTEWYLCGSPKMIHEAKQILHDRGYTDIYSEKFD